MFYLYYPSFSDFLASFADLRNSWKPDCLPDLNLRHFLSYSHHQSEFDGFTPKMTVVQSQKMGYLRIQDCHRPPPHYSWPHLPSSTPFGLLVRNRANQFRKRSLLAIRGKESAELKFSSQAQLQAYGESNLLQGQKSAPKSSNDLSRLVQEDLRDCSPYTAQTLAASRIIEPPNSTSQHSIPCSPNLQ